MVTATATRTMELARSRSVEQTAARVGRTRSNDPGKIVELADILSDPSLPGRCYTDAILDVVEGVLRDEVPVEQIVRLFADVKGFERGPEMCDLHYDPNYHEILLGQSHLRDLQAPLIRLHGGATLATTILPQAPAFSELSYFTLCPTSYRTRLLGEALAAICIHCDDRTTRLRCIAALQTALEGRAEPPSAREVGANGLALIASSASTHDERAFLSRTALSRASTSAHIEVGHYARAGLDLVAALSGERIDSREESILQIPCLSDHLTKLHARGGVNSIVFHNIREALGDEWIRNGQLVAALLKLSTDATVTILTDKPFLYNHPRVRAVDIHSAEANEFLKRSYDIAFVQSYDGGTLTGELDTTALNSIALNCHRLRCDGRPTTLGGGDDRTIVFSSAQSCNFFDPAPRTVRLPGTATAPTPLGSNSSNVYQQMTDFIGLLGLKVDIEDTKELLLGTTSTTPFTESLLSHKESCGAKSITVFNPFGGTYEEKGFVAAESGALTAEIRRAIAADSLVVLFPNCSPWASSGRIEEIRSALPEAERPYVHVPTVDRPSDPRDMLAILKVADRVVSVEGGLTHLALSSGLPVDIVRCKGSGPTAMWLPLRRCPGQSERTLVHELAFRKEERHRKNLATSIRSYVEKNRSFLATTARELEDFMVRPTLLSRPVRLQNTISEDSQDKIDGAVRSLLGELPPHEVVAAFRAKWRMPERRHDLQRFFQSLGFREDATFELVSVRDLSSGRARYGGHFVYRLAFEVDDVPLSLYCKGHTAPRNCPVRRYPGWENRPYFHLYESFFWNACRLSGLATRRCSYFPDHSDGTCIGYTLTEEIPGESSDRLVTDKNGKATISLAAANYLPSLATQLGRWCALLEILRGGDRRVANVCGAYERPSNYLVALSSAGPFITGIDHELLFCKEPCITYDRNTMANESALVRALPLEARVPFEQAFSKSFLLAWRDVTSGKTGKQLDALIASTFGENSEERKVFLDARSQIPRDVLTQVLASGAGLSESIGVSVQYPGVVGLEGHGKHQTVGVL